MSLKKTGKSQNAFSIRIFPINADSQKTPAECRLDDTSRVFQTFALMAL